jgi:hypothetical protein
MMWLALLLAPARALQHETSVGVGGEGNFWFAGAGWRHLVDAGWRIGPASDEVFPWSAWSGIRVAPGSDLPAPFAVFAGLGVDVLLGRQEPTAGFEIGWSGMNDPVVPQGHPAGVSATQADRVSGFYMAATVSPARFRFGRVAVSALDLRFGEDLRSTAILFGASYARAEVAW